MLCCGNPILCCGNLTRFCFSFVLVDVVPKWFGETHVARQRAWREAVVQSHKPHEKAEFQMWGSPSAGRLTMKANSHGPTCGFPVFFIARANASSDDARRKKKREGFSSINIFGRPEKGSNMIPIYSIVMLSQDLVHWQRRPRPRVAPAGDLLLSCEDAANDDAFLFP